MFGDVADETGASPGLLGAVGWTGWHGPDVTEPEIIFGSIALT